MILSQTIRRNRSSLLVILQFHKIQSSSLHILRPLPRHKYFKLAPATCCISSRFESVHASLEKDKILHMPKESSATLDEAETVLIDVSSLPQTSSESIPSIESVPDIPEVIQEAAIALNKLGEPTLQSLELGCLWTPVGWIQRSLEFIHVTFELPWWTSIAICVVIARMLMFPLVIKNQRHAIHMHNVMPEMQELQGKMDKARMYGNNLEMMKAGSELALFMKDKNVNPVKSMLFPMVQAPVFISFFMAIRKMAVTPVESFKEGGMLWFVDLTVMDQFYLLPLITCTTLWITLEVGADFSKLPSGTMFSRYAKYGLKLVPVIVFPFIMHFPSALLVYWASTNFVSLAQVSFLKIPAVRDYFKISEKRKHEKAPSKGKKNFVKDMKSSFSNMKFAREIAERERLDEMAFKRAGRAPPAKTYKYNPAVVDAIAQAKKL